MITSASLFLAVALKLIGAISCPFVNPGLLVALLNRYEARTGERHTQEYDDVKNGQSIQYFVSLEHL